MEFNDIHFQFEKPRAHQKELIEDTLQAFNEKKHLVAHAPTGLGKTAATLCPAISFALKENKTVFFLTSKISQHEIAVKLVKELAEKFKLNLKAVDLVGRRYFCTDPLLSALGGEGFYEICSRKRRREECNFYRNAVGFDKKEKEAARLHSNRFIKSLKGPLSHHELKEACIEAKSGLKERPLCAYEMAMKLAKKADIIIADYYHLLSPAIQEIILRRTGKSLENSLIIIDEAHNIPERIRKLLSSTLSTYSLKRAREEAKKMGAIEVEEKLNAMEKALKAIAKKSLSIETREALVSRQVFLSLIPDIDCESLASELRELGVEFLEASNKTRSNLMQVGRFLEKWPKELKAHIRFVRRLPSGTDFSLSVKALDPSIISSQLFSEAHSVVLMSGTLLPTKMYADLLGLEEQRTLLREYSSPFPLENRLNLVVPTVSTKFSQRTFEEFKKIGETVAGIVNSVPGNSAVFFPSFRILEQVASFLAEKVPREILKQRERMNSKEFASLIQRFRNSASGFGAVLLAVAGGSAAEGLDYPGNQLLCAIVVGIPLQEMNLEVKCLIDHYQEKFVEGWHYAYLYPAMTRAIQASGRVIRDSSDEGVVAFLDKRYTWKNYEKCFPKDFKKLVTEEPEKYVKLFWGGQK